MLDDDPFAPAPKKALSLEAQLETASIGELELRIEKLKQEIAACEHGVVGADPSAQRHLHPRKHEDERRSGQHAGLRHDRGDRNRKLPKPHNRLAHAEGARCAHGTEHQGMRAGSEERQAGDNPRNLPEQASRGCANLRDHCVVAIRATVP